MSALTPREQMERDLDQLLVEAHNRRGHVRDAERVLRKRQEEASEVEVAAQRTRLALFALDGEHAKNFGDANVANHKRLLELLNPDHPDGGTT